MIRTCDNGHEPTRVQSGARCPECSRRREGGRPSRQARGYGLDHVSARNVLRRSLPAPCAAPGHSELLMPEGDWVAAHVVDGDPSRGWVATCRSGNEQMKRGGWVGDFRGASPAGPAPRQLAARTGLAVPASLVDR